MISFYVEENTVQKPIAGHLQQATGIRAENAENRSISTVAC